MIAGVRILRMNIFSMCIVSMHSLIMSIYCVLVFGMRVLCILLVCVANGVLVIGTLDAVRVNSMLTCILGRSHVCQQET